MKIEVDLKKKYIIFSVAIVLILGGIFAVSAVYPVFGHTASDIDGITASQITGTIPASQITGVCKTDGTGCPAFSASNLNVGTYNWDTDNTRNVRVDYAISADKTRDSTFINQVCGGSLSCPNAHKVSLGRDYDRWDVNFNHLFVFRLWDGTYTNDVRVYGAEQIVASSDISYKKNIVTSNYGINEVMKMKPVTYYWKEPSEHGNDNGAQIGFIAQDMKKIVPEVVDGREGSYTLDYIGLIPVLTKAIQEQQIQINELKTRIAELEADK